MDSFKFVAEYIDNIILKLSEDCDAIFHKLREALNPLKYMNDENIFKHLYRASLAKRLIYSDYNGDLNLDVETFIVSRLEDLYGHDYTNILFRMIEGIRNAKTLDNEFQKEWSPKEKRFNFNFYVLPYWVYDFRDVFTFKLPRMVCCCNVICF